jgi:hypothetical protein
MKRIRERRAAKCMKRERPKGRTSSLDRRLESAGDLSVHAKIPIEKLPMDYLYNIVC